MKIIDAKKITRPLCAYPSICAIYTAVVITLISLAGRLSYINFPFEGKIFMGVDFFIVPILFFMQNIITEVYGYERSQQVNQMSIVGLLIFYGYSLFAVRMPAPPHILYQEAFNQVVSTYSRHIIAFLFALYFGAIVNQYVISKLKIIWTGKVLWLRSILSVFLGDFTYQFIGSLISRYNVLHFSQIISYDLLSYVYKLLFEAASLPLVYWVAVYIKNLEDIDIYDKNTNYNPFRLYMKL